MNHIFWLAALPHNMQIISIGYTSGLLHVPGFCCATCHVLSVTLMINDIVLMAQNAGAPGLRGLAFAEGGWCTENDPDIEKIETTWGEPTLVTTLVQPYTKPIFCPFHNLDKILQVTVEGEIPSQQICTTAGDTTRFIGDYHGLLGIYWGLLATEYHLHSLQRVIWLCGATLKILAKFCDSPSPDSGCCDDRRLHGWLIVSPGLCCRYHLFHRTLEKERQESVIFGG